MSKLPPKRPSASPSKIVFRPRQLTTGSQQRNSLIAPFKIGDRVITNGKSGTIAFIGTTKFAEGTWIGINLDEPTGKNDGSHDGVRYFETDAKHGLFCKPENVQILSINGAPQRNSVSSVLRQSTISTSSNRLRNSTIEKKNDLSSTKNFQIGDRVMIQGTKFGTLKFIGKIHVHEGIWCGIKLDGPLGKHNGKIDGRRYFRCSNNCGVFAPLRHVEKVLIDSTNARQSILSTDSFNDNLDSPSSPNSNLSELSTSSNSLNQFPTRSPPKKIRQPSLSTDLTPMETSLSSEIAELHERLKEKDLIIEKLEQMSKKDRLEINRTTEKINDMKTEIIKLQQQYNSAENENLNFMKEQFELKQRLDDLQDQVIIPDNHRLLSPDEIQIYGKTQEKILQLELINQKLVKENKRLQDEFNDNQSLKLQITNLQKQEQIFKTQLIEKETNYQRQLKEYQTKIDQMTKQETNIRLQLTIFEQEKQSYERQINELKRYKENIVPDLEKQCQMLESELQNRNLVVTNEREKYYEQQIKDYQMNINQATHETEKIRAELKQIHEENNMKEKKINELKDRERKMDINLNQGESNYEKQIKEYEDNLNRATHETQHIQTELAKLEEEKILHDNKTNTLINSLKQDYENQFETFKHQLTESKDQDRTQNIILNERLAHYEIQLKEYQMKIDQDKHEIEKLADELKSLHEEKISQEKKLKETIVTLKQDSQALQTDIDELMERERTAHKTLHQTEAKFDQQIDEYQKQLEQANLKIEQLQTELEKLQEEKMNFNETITHNYETLKAELEDRNQHENTTIKEYKSQIEQSVLEIKHLQSKLTSLEEEKVNMENELNNTINTLKEDYEKFQDKQEIQISQTLHQHELEFKQQIQEYQDKLEQAYLKIQHFQSESENLKEEKIQSNYAIDSLTQELEALRTELQDRDRIQNTTLNDLKIHYQSQIKEYQTKIDQSILEIQDLRTHLTNLEEEKTTIEHDLNEDINILKENYEKFESEQKKTIRAQYVQEIDEYQKNLESYIHEIADVKLELVNLQEEKENNDKLLNDRIDSLKIDFQKQIQLLEKQKIELKKENNTQEERLKEYESTMDETNALFQRVENLIEINKKLKEEIEDLKNQKDPKEIEELTQQITDLQQMHMNLLEKQATKEQEYVAEKKAQEKLLQEKLEQYQMQIAMIKSEYMVEMENTRLVHDQEMLRLKSLLPKTTPIPTTKGKK